MEISVPLLLVSIENLSHQIRTRYERPTTGIAHNLPEFERTECGIERNEYDIGLYRCRERNAPLKTIRQEASKPVAGAIPRARRCDAIFDAFVTKSRQLSDSPSQNNAVLSGRVSDQYSKCREKCIALAPSRKC